VLPQAVKMQTRKTVPITRVEWRLIMVQKPTRTLMPLLLQRFGRAVKIILVHIQLESDWYLSR